MMQKNGVKYLVVLFVLIMQVLISTGCTQQASPRQIVYMCENGGQALDPSLCPTKQYPEKNICEEGTIYVGGHLETTCKDKSGTYLGEVICESSSVLAGHNYRCSPDKENCVLEVMWTEDCSGKGLVCQEGECK